jgi:hypothetical protein
VDTKSVQGNYYYSLSGWKLDYFTPLIRYLSIPAMISSKLLSKPTYAIAAISAAVLHQQ